MHKIEPKKSNARDASPIGHFTGPNFPGWIVPVSRLIPSVATVAAHRSTASSTRLTVRCCCPWSTQTMCLIRSGRSRILDHWLLKPDDSQCPCIHSSPRYAAALLASLAGELRARRCGFGSARFTAFQRLGKRRYDAFFKTSVSLMAVLLNRVFSHASRGRNVGGSFCSNQQSTPSFLETLLRAHHELV